MPKDKDILLFSQYLAYRIGGAEESLLRLAERRHGTSARIHVLSFKGLATSGTVEQTYHFPPHWRTHWVSARFPLARFPYMNYFLNKKSLVPFFKNHKIDSLYCTSIFGAAAVAYAKCEQKTLYVQSEIEMGVPWNHETGWKHWARRLYNWTEAPFRWHYTRNFRKALAEAHLIAPSQYIADLLKEKFLAEGVEIVLPIIDYDTLKAEFMERQSHIPEGEKGVVFVGDAVYKGSDIARALAKAMPATPFHFFSKIVDKKQTKGNITTHPWQRHPADVYQYARLVIMPSRCRESFGRVAREAQSLGIPVLVSGHGGLPEAVLRDPAAIVSDYENMGVWLARVRQILSA